MIDIDNIRNQVIKVLDDVEYDISDTQQNISIVEEIRQVLDTHAITPEHVATVAVACKENLQIRDFLMGVRVEKKLDTIIGYLLTLISVLKKDLSVPFVTILSSYLYELEQTDDAKEIVNEVLEFAPEYNLAQLLKSCYDNGFPTNFMKEASFELHGQVLDVIYDRKENE